MAKKSKKAEQQDQLQSSPTTASTTELLPDSKTSTNAVDEEEFTMPADRPSNFIELMAHQDNTYVTRKFIKTTIVMFTVPFIIYFSFDKILLTELVPSADSRMIWSAVAAVVVVQFIMGLYVYSALQEKDDRPRPLFFAKKYMAHEEERYKHIFAPAAEEPDPFAEDEQQQHQSDESSAVASSYSSSSSSTSSKLVPSKSEMINRALKQQQRQQQQQQKKKTNQQEQSTPSADNKTNKKSK